jgi:RimJ/RimL family protein N-acetyltransferase
LNTLHAALRCKPEWKYDVDTMADHPFLQLACPASVSSSGLLLRPWRADDFEAWFAMNRDPRVREFFGGDLLDEAQARAHMQIRSDGVLRDGWGKWALELIGCGFIGTVGIAPWQHPITRQWYVEGAWRLAYAHWGKGYATQAARAAFDFGFETLKLMDVVAYTAQTNLGSQAVMRRLGMVHRNDLDFIYPDEALAANLRPQRVYQITAEAFSGLKPAWQRANAAPQPRSD